MSEENVEIVRRYYEEWPEASELPEWVAGFWESDGDYYPVRGFPEARPCHGRAPGRGAVLMAIETEDTGVTETVEVDGGRGLRSRLWRL